MSATVNIIEFSNPHVWVVFAEGNHGDCATFGSFLEAWHFACHIGGRPRQDNKLEAMSK
jgi:hypothetical protein